jgi:hypothetical protein
MATKQQQTSFIRAELSWAARCITPGKTPENDNHANPVHPSAIQGSDRGRAQGEAARQGKAEERGSVKLVRSMPLYQMALKHVF